METFSDTDWKFRTGTNELDRVVEIVRLRAHCCRLQILLNESRVSHETQHHVYSYPVLMGYEREQVEKELASTKVTLMLLGAKS